MDKVWPLITNTDALRVNQAWAGFSGSVFLAATETVTLADALGAAAPVPAWQAFNKPISATEIAVFVMNHAATSATITVPFSSVPGRASTHIAALRARAPRQLRPPQP
jgi:hypothetical protein